MAVAEQHKTTATGKYVIVYVCLLALAGIQFVIAYQNIDPGQMFVPHDDSRLRGGTACSSDFYAFVGREPWLRDFCRCVYNFCPARHAIWMD